MDQPVDQNWGALADDIPSVFTGFADTQPESPAILAPGRAPLSFAGLHAQQHYVRKTFTEWGIGRGDTVAVILPKGPEMAVAIAILSATATAVPMAPDLSPDDYERLFRRCAVRALVLPQGAPHAARTTAERLGVLRIDLMVHADNPAGAFTLSAANDPDKSHRGRNLGSDIAYIMGTSGTTSERKLVPYTHENVVLYANAMKNWLRIDAADRSLHLVPMHFASGLHSGLMVPLLSGASVVCPAGYQAETFFSMLEDYRPSWFTAGFTIHRDILHHVDGHADELARTNIRFIKSSSGRLEPDEVARLEQAFHAPVIVGLSSTETCRITFNPLPPETRKPDSVGIPVVNDVRIRDRSGRFAGVGEEGEIVVRGPLVFHGYLDDPKATGRAFSEGWYHTGDLGKFDSDGYLYLTGRIKEIINAGGEKILPAEIDRHLQSHPGVAEAAAFGLPHPTLGEVVVAAIVPEPGMAPSEQSLKKHVRALLTGSKVPRKIFFMEKLPRSGNGKIQRHKLPQMIPQPP